MEHAAIDAASDICIIDAPIHGQASIRSCIDERRIIGLVGTSQGDITSHLDVLHGEVHICTGHSGGHKGDEGSRAVFIGGIVYHMMKGQIFNCTADNAVNKATVVGDAGDNGCGSIRFFTDHISIEILNEAAPLFDSLCRVGKIQIGGDLKGLTRIPISSRDAVERLDAVDFDNLRAVNLGQRLRSIRKLHRRNLPHLAIRQGDGVGLVGLRRKRHRNHRRHQAHCHQQGQQSFFHILFLLENRVLCGCLSPQAWEYK